MVKITKQELNQIIKEEVKNNLNNIYNFDKKYNIGTPWGSEETINEYLPDGIGTTAQRSIIYKQYKNAINHFYDIFNSATGDKKNIQKLLNSLDTHYLLGPIYSILTNKSNYEKHTRIIGTDYERDEDVLIAPFDIATSISFTFKNHTCTLFLIYSPDFNDYSCIINKGEYKWHPYPDNIEAHSYKETSVYDALNNTLHIEF